MKRCLLLPAVLLAVLLLGAPAQAGWRYAEWGMDEAAVIAASRGQAKPYDVALKQSWGEYPGLVAPWSDLRQSFEIWFYFERRSGALYALRLVPTGGYWCIDIRARLTARYGTPHHFDDQVPVWIDTANNNRISLIGFRGCSIKYEALAMPR